MTMTNLLPPFAPAGASHAQGAVPDPGATSHSHFPYVLGDDGAWHKWIGLVGINYVATNESTTSSTPVDLTTVQSIAFTLDETRNVMIEGFANVTNGTANSAAIITCNVDGTDENGSVVGQEAVATANLWHTINFTWVTSLAAGAHTIKLRFYTSSGTAGAFAFRALKVWLAP